MSSADLPNASNERIAPPGGLLRALLDNSPNIVFVKDLDGRYLEVNHSFETLLSVPRERALGRTDAELFPSDAATQFREHDLQVAREGRAIEFEETTEFFGGPRVSLAQKFPIRDPSGRIVATGGIVADFTARKASEEALERYAAQQKVLLGAMPSILWTTDRELRITDSLGAGLALMGLTPGQIVGRSLEEVIQPGSQSLECHRRALAGERAQYDVTYGSLTLAATVEPLLDGGRITGVIGAAIDITPQLRAERALSESRRRYAALFETMLDAVVISDDSGRYVDANPAALELFGRSRAELLALSVADVSAQAPGATAEQFGQFVADGTMGGEYAIRRKDGGTRVVEYRAVANLEPGLHLAVLRDITERKRAEIALRRSEERFRDLFEGSPLPMWAFDQQTLEFRAVNEAAVQIYGYSRQEFASMRAGRLRPAEEVPEFERHLQTLEEGRYYTVRTRHRRSNGAVFTVDIFHHVVRLEGRPTVVSLIHDVSDRVRLQDERDRSQRQLQEVSRRLVTLQEEERRALAADMHDRVGQALSALGIKLTLIESMVAPRDAQAASELHESYAILEEAGRWIRGTISELRPPALHDYGLVAALRDLAETSRRRYGFEVDVDAIPAPARLPDAVEGAMFRIAQEAIANIAKHAGAGRVSLTLRTRAGLTSLRVIDNGRGFDTRALRAPGKLSRWGILMMRERAEAVGARLRIASRPGRGTALFVAWKERRGDPRSHR
jgi:PAS domain S-box-containing protein